MTIMSSEGQASVMELSISLNRKVCGIVGGNKPDRLATSLKDLKGAFAHSDFALLKDFAQLPLLRAVHLAMWKRIAPVPRVRE